MLFIIIIIIPFGGFNKILNWVKDSFEEKNMIIFSLILLISLSYVMVLLSLLLFLVEGLTMF